MWIPFLKIFLWQLTVLFSFVSVQIEAHDDDVNAVAFADETSQILFSGSDDGLCKVLR